MKGDHPPRLTHLAWDSEHFEFPVAQIDAPDLEDECLSQVLAEARRQAIVLIYWRTHSGRFVSPPVVQEYRGLLADRRATFGIDLTQELDASVSGVFGPYHIRDYTGDDTSPLEELAVLTGEWSRFNMDPMISRKKFEELYRIWARRSAQHQLADAVLVAEAPGAGIQGFITVLESATPCQIGLLGVAVGARRKGVGSLLVGAAHLRMIGKGARRATVVTQLDNQSACRFYARRGYALERIEHCYHFWPAPRIL